LNEGGKLFGIGGATVYEVNSKAVVTLHVIGLLWLTMWMKIKFGSNGYLPKKETRAKTPLELAEICGQKTVLKGVVVRRF
jgi:hypothetical protein